MQTGCETAMPSQSHMALKHIDSALLSAGVKHPALSDAMGNAVRIGVQPGKDWLDFDLAGVLSAVGPHPHLDWWMYAVEFNCDVTTIWPEGIGIEERTDERPGLSLDWTTMERLAAVCHQIIDGFFIGYDQRGRPALQLAVIDSSYWTVWARYDAVLEAVRGTFANVEPYPEPPPPPLVAPGR